MLSDFTGAEKVYIACGYTDLRKGIDGLATLVQSQFQLDPFTNTLFLFCGRRKDRIKALYWEGNGFVLLAPLPELMDRKKRDIMERKGDKEDENKRQKQQKESSAAAL